MQEKMIAAARGYRVNLILLGKVMDLSYPLPFCLGRLCSDRLIGGTAKWREAKSPSAAKDKPTDVSQISDVGRDETRK